MARVEIGVKLYLQGRVLTGEIALGLGKRALILMLSTAWHFEWIHDRFSKLIVADFGPFTINFWYG